MTSLAI
jgi:hypothetical protein